MTTRQQQSRNTNFEVKEVLRGAGLKVTPIRVAILEFLKKSHGPFTVQQIFQKLKSNKKLKSLDLATIYRNMEKFVETSSFQSAYLLMELSGSRLKTLHSPPSPSLYFP